MRALVQRVAEARVDVAGVTVGAIGPGLLVLAGVEAADVQADFDWIAGKLVKLRIFADAAGVMNRSVSEVGGQILAVSQFTLFASTRKGNRPSWGRAAPPEIAAPMFERFHGTLVQAFGAQVPSGVFGADMQVSLVNDGPVTLLLDSKNPE